MIHADGNVFTPGSLYEGTVTPFKGTPDEFEDYIRDNLWTTGLCGFITGPPQSGKTTLGLNLVARANSIGVDASWWTVPDFIADLKRLWAYEDQVRTIARDDALWQEYLKWERDFWAWKETELLVLDDLGEAYTPMHHYEINHLLRQREALNRATFVICSTSSFGNLSEALRSVAARGLVIDTGKL